MFDAVVIDSEGTIFTLGTFKHYTEAEACIEYEQQTQCDMSYTFKVLERGA